MNSKELIVEILKKLTRETQPYTEDLGGGVCLEMVAIPGGKFMMGTPRGEGRDSEKPQHEVTVQPFFMGKYPITQAQWRAISFLPKVKKDLEPAPSYFKGYNRPVEQVSWDDAQEFCNRLSKYTKHTDKEYRLPTEAEWEYACRSVISHQSSVISKELTVEEWNQQYNQPFHFGETISTELANYDGNYTYGRGVKGENRGQTTPVGYFKVTNNFGLSDMHGNVWEWCQDDWHENYEGAPTDGSARVSENSSIKVLRSGSWADSPYNCRSAYHSKLSRDRSYFNCGFRVASYKNWGSIIEQLSDLFKNNFLLPQPLLCTFYRT